MDATNLKRKAEQFAAEIATQAQTLAEKAVQLEPDLPGYRDTLAEVLFQRGKKDEAIVHMKKCLELEPKREYYKKQLKRFEAGDPKAEVPLEGEKTISWVYIPKANPRGNRRGALSTNRRESQEY